MATEEHNDLEHVDQPDASGRFSRRGVLGRVGLVAAGAALGAAVPTVGATPAGAATSKVGDGPGGTTVAEFVAHIDQTGLDFSAYGYLTRLVGVDNAALFSDQSDRSEKTALFTASAHGKLVTRSSDGAVHSLDIAGEMQLFQRTNAGATYTDPASFATGTAIATYSMTLQDVLTVISPDTGIPTLSGDMTQLDSKKLSGAAGSKAVGHKGLRLRFLATGIGTRSEATAPKATLTVAGSFAVA